MTRWRPHIDLARLLDALEGEVLAASDDAVRLVAAPREIAAAAAEVRQVIAAVLGDPDGAGGVDPRLPPAAFLREHRVRQH